MNSGLILLIILASGEMMIRFDSEWAQGGGDMQRESNVFFILLQKV